MADIKTGKGRPHRRESRWLQVVAAAGLLAAATHASAFSLTNNQRLNGSATLVGSGETIVPSAGPAYDWTDNNGDGNTNGPGDDASSGLNLGNYRIYTDDGTSLTLKLRNSNGKGTINGTTNTAISTRWGGDTGDINIYEAGPIDCGGLDTGSSGSQPECGDINIGQSNSPVGNVRVDFLDAHQGAQCLSGTIRIYSDGYVKVQTSDGTVKGDIQTWYEGNRWTGRRAAGSVLICHDGELAARDINARCGTIDNWTRAGDVTLLGDLKGDGPSGPLSAGSIMAHSLYITEGEYHAGGGQVVIAGYTGVSVSNIWTYRKNTIYYDAGNVTITNIAGNVTITGGLDLGGLGTHAGTLLITGVTGRVTLTNLDLSLMENAYFAAPGGIWITGVLTNFDTANPASGQLDCPAEGRIYYDHTVPGNAYLKSWTYTLKSGGKLRRVLPHGVVIYLK